jgi:hypothetical protein
MLLNGNLETTMDATRTMKMDGEKGKMMTRC